MAPFVRAILRRVVCGSSVTDNVKPGRRRRRPSAKRPDAPPVNVQFDALARDIWIADDPTAIDRVSDYLSAHSSTPFCNVCISRKLRLRIEDVRAATARLARTAQCEQGLWWCGKCSTKGSVTVAIVGRPRGEP